MTSKYLKTLTMTKIAVKTVKKNIHLKRNRIHLRDSQVQTQNYIIAYALKYYIQKILIKIIHRKYNILYLCTISLIEIIVQKKK